MLLSPSEKIDRLTGLFNINLHYANIEDVGGREEGRSTRRPHIRGAYDRAHYCLIVCLTAESFLKYAHFLN